MSEKVKCSHCINKLPRLVCGCKEGSHFRETMNPNDHCDFFVNNPAQDYYSKALVAIAVEDAETPDEHERQARETIENLEKALQFGLPEDDELNARYSLGEAYFSLLRHMPEEQRARSQELATSLRELEQGVTIDARGGYAHFAQPLHASRLMYLSTAYIKTSQNTAPPGDVTFRIQYLEGKLRHFDYLPSPPLLLLLHLGELYASQGNKQRAQEYLNRILHAPVNPGSESDANVRQAAERQLRNMETTQPKEKSGCFIATAVFNDPHAHELSVLRRVRDEHLQTSRSGKTFISLYYCVSPPIARAIGKSSIAAMLVRTLVLRPIVGFCEWLLPNKAK